MNPETEQLIKRGDIKKFRELLNQEDDSSKKHTHQSGSSHYRQLSRSYGDYLYHQDRVKFMVELREWIEKGRPDTL